MNETATSLLSLAGSLTAASSLAAGEALQTEEQAPARRFTPRMVLSLVFLGMGVLGIVSTALQAQGGLSLVNWLPSLLLAVGTGLTLWAYVSGPRRRGDESLWQRVTRRGQLALGLLLAAQLADLANGRAVAPLKQLLPAGDGPVFILGALGLLLVLLGTGAVAVLYRSGSLLLTREGPILKRLSLPAKGTLLLLPLALVVVGLAGLLAPGIELFMALLFLTLGIVTGILALCLDHKTGTRLDSTPWGISPRGWVSLSLLALTAVTLGTQEYRLLGVVGEPNEARGEKTQGEQSVPGRPVFDRPSVWGLRPSPAVLAGTADEGRELVRTREELVHQKNRVADLEKKLKKPNTPQPESNPSTRPPENPSSGH